MSSCSGSQEALSTNTETTLQNCNELDSVARKLSSAAYTFGDLARRFSGNYNGPASIFRFKQIAVASLNQYHVPENSRISILKNALRGSWTIRALS